MSVTIGTVFRQHIPEFTGIDGTPCQFLPSLTIASDGEAEMSVNISSRPRHNTTTNNVSNYVTLAVQALGTLFHKIFVSCEDSIIVLIIHVIFK